MKSLIIDLQYFPIVDYYISLYNYSDIIFEQYDMHQKMSFRNRTIISGANGPINLSVPLLGGRDQKTITKDVKIDNTSNWKIRHLRSLESSYNRSPYFEFYAAGLRQLFSVKHEFLFDWNFDCLGWLHGISGLKAELMRSEKFVKHIPEDTGTDHRGHFTPRLTKATGKGALTYRQVFEDRYGFQHGMSILDLLFSVGGQGVYQAGIARAGIDLNQ